MPKVQEQGQREGRREEEDIKPKGTKKEPEGALPSSSQHCLLFPSSSCLHARLGATSRNVKRLMVTAGRGASCRVDPGQGASRRNGMTAVVK